MGFPHSGHSIGVSGSSSSSIVFSTSTKGTCAATAPNRSGAWFTTAPIGAIKLVLEKAGWDIGDVELFEVNEAFASVTMAAMHELDIDHAKINVNGGACALGHPIGASGARVVVTLINAMRHRGLKKGIAALCIGGGEATAIAFELP